MSLTVRELAAKLGLDTDAQSFAKGDAAISLVKFGLEKLVEVAAEAVSKFVEVVQGTAEAGDQIKELSQATGVGAESLQVLANAAKTEGVSIDGMGHSLIILTKMMAAAKGGAKDTAAAFSKLGVTVDDGRGHIRNADEVFLDLAESMSKMPDSAEKTALAFKVLGKSGPDMIKVLNMGREEIEEMGRAGLILTQDQIEAGDELIKTQRKLGAVTGGIWKTAIAPLLPEITSLVKAYTSWRKANAEVMKQRIQQFIGALIAIVRGLGSAFTAVIGVMTFFKKNWLAAVAIAVAGAAAWIVSNYALAASFVATQATAVGAALAAAVAWLTAVAPVVAVAAAVAYLLVLLDDLRGFLAGEDSAIGAGIDAIFGKGMSTDVVETLHNLWLEVGEAIHEAYDWLAKMVTKLEWILKWTPPALIYRGHKAIFAAQHTAWNWIKEKAGAAINGTPAESESFGPAEAPTGIGASLRERAQLRHLRNAYALPEDTLGPTGPSPAYAPSGQPSVVQQTNTFHITQLPGEDGEHFAERVAAIAKQERETSYEHAGAALPATE